MRGEYFILDFWRVDKKYLPVRSFSAVISPREETEGKGRGEWEVDGVRGKSIKEKWKRGKWEVDGVRGSERGKQKGKMKKGEKEAYNTQLQRTTSHSQPHSPPLPTKPVLHTN